IDGASRPWRPLAHGRTGPGRPAPGPPPPTPACGPAAPARGVPLARGVQAGQGGAGGPEGGGQPYAVFLCRCVSGSNRGTPDPHGSLSVLSLEAARAPENCREICKTNAIAQAGAGRGSARGDPGPVPGVAAYLDGQAPFQRVED